MVLMADQDNGIALARELDRLQMNFGDQRTGGVNHFKIASPSVVAHGRRYAVSAENDPRPGRNLVQFLDKDRARAAQLIHNVPVMDDFLANINRRAVQIQRDLDHVDGADDTSAKPPWPQQDNLLGRSGHSLSQL